MRTPARIARHPLHPMLLLLLAAGAPSLGAEAALPAADAPAIADEILEEVEIRGTKLWQLRQAIIAAEDRFHALYNELNEHDEFDVGCRVEAPIGTRLKKRVCHIAFMEEAQSDYARSLLGGQAGPTPDQVWTQRSGDYYSNARELLRRHPDLLRLAQARERAATKYEAERKKRFKGRWILFE